MRRPTLTVGDAEAIERLAPSVRVVDIMVGEGVQSTAERAFYRGERTASNQILGVSTDYATISFMKLQLGRFFTEPEVTHRRRVVVLGDGPYQVLFGSKGIDPINKKIRLGAIEYTVIGVMDKRPSLGSLDTGQDNLAIIPYTTHQVVFNIDVTRPLRDGNSFGGIIGILPRDDAPPGQALAEVEEIMRVRHGLKLDEPNDFDIITQDALLRTWEQISQRGAARAGRDLVDRADGRRHRRDGDHDDLGDRAHAGDRRAQGARRTARRDPRAVPG